MILTDDTENTKTTTFIGEIDADHYALCEALSVKLTGGVRGGLFTGSGVVFKLDETSHKTYVVTAKHNLHIAGKGTGNEGDDLVDYFKSQISVKVEAVANTHAISDVVFPDGKAADFNYDVCILEVTSQTLAQGVSQALSKGLRNEFVSSKGRSGSLWTDRSNRQLWDFLSRDTAKNVLTGANGFKGYHLLQIGNGKTSSGSMASDGFKKRGISIAAPRNQALSGCEWIDKTKEGYEDVFIFPSTNTFTSAPGDSGGPVFAFDSTRTRSFLVGVNLGANFYKNKVDNNPNSATVNNAFTVLTTDNINGVAGYDLQGVYG
ncbi:MAG: hypothetical protein U0441_34475 [Polyangiaceae bacterium]